MNKVQTSFGRYSFIRRSNIDGKVDAEMISLIAEQLRSNFLFLSFTDDQIIKLAKMLETVEYEPGSAIITQGERGTHREMHISMPHFDINTPI